MSYLSVSKTEHFVEKYLITDSIIENIISICAQKLQLNYILSFIPLVSFYEADTLIQELLNSIYKSEPLLEYITDEIEPLQTMKDNYQSDIRIEQIPISQIIQEEEFITSITKFRNASQKSSLKSSVSSIRKISAQKIERSQQTQCGSFYKQISPIPLINDDDTDDEQDRFYRGVYEMKKKQQEQIRQNKLIADQQKSSLHQKLTDLKKKYKDCIVTYDNDGTIIVPHQKRKEIQLQVQPETRVHLNMKNKVQNRIQTKITNIVNSSVQRQQRIANATSIKTEVSMETQPVRVNSSFSNFDIVDITSKKALKVLLQNRNLKLTKKEFSSLIQCENNIGDVLSQKLKRMTQLQLQRLSYIEQQNQSKSMTPLRKEERKDTENSFKAQSISKKLEEGKININNFNKVYQLDNSFSQQPEFQDFKTQSRLGNYHNEKIKNRELPHLQIKNTKSSQFKMSHLNHSEIHPSNSLKFRSITSQV